MDKTKINCAVIGIGLASVMGAMARAGVCPKFF